MADIDITIGADASPAEKELSNFEKEIVKQLGSISSAVNKVEGNLGNVKKTADTNLEGVSSAFTSMKTIALGALAIFTASELISFLKGSVQAAAEAEKSLQALNTALKLSGDFSDAASAEFVSLGDEIQSTTGISKDLILQQSAIAKSFGLSNQQAQNLIKTAVDLSAATGKELGPTVEALGKTYAGVTGKLDEQVPALKRLTKEQLAAGDAVKILGERYSGTAAALTQTFSGAVARASTLFGELQETVGSVIVDNPAVVAAINAMGTALDGITKTLEENKKPIADFISSIILFSAKVIPEFIRAAGVLVTAVDTMIGGLGIFADAITVIIAQAIKDLVRFARFIPGATTALDAMGVNINAVSDFADALGETGERGIKKMSSPLSGLAETLASATVATENLAAQTLQQANASDKAAKGLQNQDKQQKQVILSAKELEEIEKKRIETSAALGQVALDSYRAVVEGQKLVLDFEKQIQTAYAAAIQERLNNPLITSGQFETILNEVGVEVNAKLSVASVDVAQGIGILNAALNGPQGAITLVSKGLGAIADTFLPGIGGAVAGIVGVLAQGPEKVKELVAGFVKALPQIVTAIAESIPAIVIALAENADKIIEALVVAMPKVAIALAKSIITGEFQQAIVDGLISSFKELFRKAQPDIDRIGRSFEKFGAELAKIDPGPQIEAVFNKIAANMKAAFDIFSVEGSSALDAVSAKLETIFQPMFTYLEARFQAFYSTVSAIFRGIEAVASVVFRPVTDAIAQMAAAATAAFIGIRDFLGTFFGGLFTTLSNFFIEAYGLATKFFDFVKGGFVGLYDGAAAGFERAMTRLGFAADYLIARFEPIREQFRLLSNTISGFGKDIEKFFTDAGRTFSTFGAKISAALDNALTNFGPNFQKTMTDAAQYFQDAFDTDKISAKLTKIGDDIYDSLKAAFDRLTGGISSGAASIKSETKGFINDPLESLGFGLTLPSVDKDISRSSLSSESHNLALIRLANVVDRLATKNDNDTEALERAIKDQNKPVTINLSISEQKLSTVLLNLNRQGFRITA